ncbi:hypothetical protein V501_06340 [Pseudogymnoascus sp. VKM F-4519 (FW-2642)]|nr:hypothetical protein V501_06340 [Pseudogymnoascus sp. VKM F-4519 (FW-2642)]
MASTRSTSSDGEMVDPARQQESTHPTEYLILTEDASAATPHRHPTILPSPAILATGTSAATTHYIKTSQTSSLIAFNVRLATGTEKRVEIPEPRVSTLASVLF